MSLLYLFIFRAIFESGELIVCRCVCLPDGSINAQWYAGDDG